MSLAYARPEVALFAARWTKLELTSCSCRRPIGLMIFSSTFGGGGVEDVDVPSLFARIKQHARLPLVVGPLGEPANVQNVNLSVPAKTGA